MDGEKFIILEKKIAFDSQTFFAISFESKFLVLLSRNLASAKSNLLSFTCNSISAEDFLSV